MGREKKSGFSKFLLGAALGVGLGVLFAPQDGKKTRAQLKEKIDDLIEKAKEIDPKEVKQSIEKKIEEIKGELADLDKEKVIEIAKKKAANIKKKADELVKLAVEKGTPVLEKAASDVRDTTIKVLKNTVDKLEASKNDSKKTAK